MALARKDASLDLHLVLGGEANVAPDPKPSGWREATNTAPTQLME